MRRAATIDLAELELLLEPFAKVAQGERYKTAHWLKVSFDEPVWIIFFDREIILDWRVPLYDGSILTSAQHEDLLTALKSWLIVGSHVDVTGGAMLEHRSERARIQRAIHCVDYLLLRADKLGLLKVGFSSLSQNDLAAMLATIASNRSIANSVYEWPRRLGEYLRSGMPKLDKGTTAILKETFPGIDDLSFETEDRLTDLTNEELVDARLWLASKDYYKFGGRSHYRFSVLNSAIASDVFAGTLFGRSLSLLIAEELCIGPQYRIKTEYPRARVTSERDERADERSVARYTETISLLRLLKADGLNVPEVVQDALKSAVKGLDLKQVGRFRTLPHTLVFGALRSAIEYALTNGADLVDSYLAVAKAALESGTSVAVFCERNDLSPHITPGAKRLGVERWIIEPRPSDVTAARDPKLPAEWYGNLRRNTGLFESIRILYGAVQVVVGTLMARRLGELLDLPCDSCLDSSRSRLVFANRKSGVAGLRKFERRPIPSIAVDLIEILQRLQRGLVELGVIQNSGQLFAYPRFQGDGWMVNLSKTNFCESIDYFCDWAELPLDSSGCRYYIRQHQLRRFFAMLFFWGGGFGGLDTLRWFLGHTDAQHLWHYITESTPGLTIRSVAAEWAAYSVKHRTEEARLLSLELAEHFATTDFSVLDDDTLASYIEDLMEQGRLTIEPEFLDSGRNYRIAVVLRTGSET